MTKPSELKERTHYQATSSLYLFKDIENVFRYIRGHSTEGSRVIETGHYVFVVRIMNLTEVQKKDYDIERWSRGFTIIQVIYGDAIGVCAMPNYHSYFKKRDFSRAALDG